MKFGGAICERGCLMPDRLNYPLKRIGDKGGGQSQKLIWEQALDEVAEKLALLRDQYGPEALAFTHGSLLHLPLGWSPFFNLFSSPNLCGANNIFMCPSYATEYATYGGIVWSEVMGSKCVVIWCAEPSKSDPIGLFAQTVRAKKQGAKLIVIDPRRTKEAEIGSWPHSALFCRGKRMRIVYHGKTNHMLLIMRRA